MCDYLKQVGNDDFSVGAKPLVDHTDFELEARSCTVNIKLWKRGTFLWAKCISSGLQIRRFSFTVVVQQNLLGVKQVVAKAIKAFGEL